MANGVLLNSPKWYPPQAPLRYFNDGGRGGGGLTEVHILYPKNPNFGIFLPKKHPYILAYPKNSHTNSKLHFLTMLLLIWADEKYNTQKIPVFFRDPKKFPRFS